MIKDKPILFSAPMIQALLADRKTQTRRIIEPQPTPLDDKGFFVRWRINKKYVVDGLFFAVRNIMFENYKYKISDNLWVRESFSIGKGYDDVKIRDINYQDYMKIWYSADTDDNQDGTRGKNRPSIFMPRWACRIELEIGNIRVERLQDITEEDAIAEGAIYHDGLGVGHSGWTHDRDDGIVYPTAKESYFRLWEKINGRESLEANPFLWVVDFKRVK